MLLGEISPYVDLDSFEVYECRNCRCRFVWRQEEVHEIMHATEPSPYNAHKKIVQRVHRLFQEQRLKQLKQFLLKNPKYRFVIENISLPQKGKKFLEIGCSLGYLSSYFILSGADVIGADISPTVIQKATSLFGPFFVSMDDGVLNQQEAFDTIFSVGTIGCVEKPLQFTQRLLNLLKPGGRLLYNVPNATAVRQMGFLWTTLTPPPDLITMFEENFWENFFGNSVTVDISYRPYSHAHNAVRHLQNVKKTVFADMEDKHLFQFETGNDPQKSNLSGKIRKPLLALLFGLSFLGLIKRYKTDFGMFVTLTKKA